MERVRRVDNARRGFMVMVGVGDGSCGWYVMMRVGKERDLRMG